MLGPRKAHFLGESKMEFMDTMIAFMGDNMAAAGSAGLVVWEIVRRIWPTKNPASVGHDIKDFLAKVGQVAEKMSGVLDVFLPQKIKELEKK